MSEYQYYEFKAVDRPLDRTAQGALRSLSTRAQITATSFTNHYEWGDFRGDPRKLVEQWFDLHLYLANWGSRRLIIRLPARLLDREKLLPFLGEVDWVKVWTVGDNLVVDISPEEAEGQEDWDDGSGWLAALEPLREDLLAGDLRLFHLLWLNAVQYELVADTDIEPMAGIGPLTEPLEAFAAFFDIDSDLVQAAAEQGCAVAGQSGDDLRETLAAIPERDKVELLLRVVDGDVHVGTELRRMTSDMRPVTIPRRTAGDLRHRAKEIAAARQREEAERLETQRRRQAEKAAGERRARLAVLKQRGADVWREVEDEVERRNAPGYDRAASLLADLQALAVQEKRQGDFDRRLAAIRTRHEKKGKFIDRLTRLDRDSVV